MRKFKKNYVLWPIDESEKEFEEYKAQAIRELVESEECKRFLGLMIDRKWELRFTFRLPRKRGRPFGSKNIRKADKRDTEQGPEIKKRRGRPPGSKNKKRNDGSIDIDV